MKRKNPLSIGSIFKEWVEDDPVYSDMLYQERARELCEKRLEKVSQYIRKVECKDFTLYISVHSSAIARVLREKKDFFINSINEELNFRAVQDIIVRI